MKSMAKKLMVVMALFMAMTSAMAQTKLTEGTVVYAISMTNDDLDPQVAAMMPKEMSLSFKGDMSKSDMKMGMGTMDYIFNAKTKITTMLMDMMGNKTAVKMTESDLEKQSGKEKKTTVKTLPDTKVICGYTCNKAEITVEGEKDKQIVFYTKDIVTKNANAMKAGLKGIDGFPMEYVISQNGIGMKMSVKSVSKDKVDDNIFKIPSGYKEMTLDEMVKQMGGAH